MGNQNSINQNTKEGKLNMFDNYRELSPYDFSQRSQTSNNTLTVLDFIDYNKIYGIPVIQHDKQLIAF